MVSAETVATIFVVYMVGPLVALVLYWLVLLVRRIARRSGKNQAAGGT